MRLPTQSHLIPAELWLAARILERRCIGDDDDAVCNAVAANIILDDVYFAEVVAQLPHSAQVDPIVQQAIALIRRYTTPPDGDPLLRPLPAIADGAYTGQPDTEKPQSLRDLSEDHIGHEAKP